MAGRRIPMPRGRMLGGSSAINGGAWVRGNRRDFDDWAELGNRGWSYDDVLPIFRSMETFEGGDERVRGREGPIRVSTIARKGRLFESFFEAARGQGLEENPDHNGMSQEGIGMTQASIWRGRRMSTYSCYLKQARTRSNLVVITNALAHQLIIENGCCTGVRYRAGGLEREVRASREVILCGGVIGSPQLLELSGIGSAQRLQALGIQPVIDLPGVGENLRDHLTPRLKWTVGRHGVTLNEQASGWRSLWHGLSYVTKGSGFLSMPAGALRCFFRTQPGLADADAMFVLQPMLASAQLTLGTDAGITMATHQLRPESSGSVHITSTDPNSKPAIRFNFLTHPVDRACTLAAVKIVRSLVQSPALQWLGGKEILPGPRVTSDDELFDYIAQTAETAYHPVGTCKMGNDSRSVVDHELRLRGIDGLRVADASIMPTMISGNTNAASIMIGEKAARMIADAAH